MSAEVLRQAAALMRERAVRARSASGPDAWSTTGAVVVEGDEWEVAFTSVPIASHIASWHPAVALAVADLLEQTAHLHDHGSLGPLDMPAALAVATAYLGTDQ